MTKNQLIEIADLYYDITNGKPQIGDCPDVNIYISSISWSVRVEIFINGFTTGVAPDKIHYLNNESSDDEVTAVIEILKLCKEIRDIYVKHASDSKVRLYKKDFADLSKTN